MSRILSGIAQIDAAFCVRIYLLSGKRALDSFFYAISRAGDGYLYGLAGLVLALSFPERASQILLAGGTAFAFELSLYKLLKNTIKRVRPCEAIAFITNRIAPPDTFSFPSGHTAAATVMTVILGAFFPVLIAPMVIYSFLVGFSRVYNGVHYPGDVIAGAALGFGSAELALLIFS
ncbi:MAG TPA: phosphatase PAP2 family protein [Spirochaetia bacterium]|jgi:undecaprenyl-diphosphatase|nr:phosphatase PAP2 family protein [Spirochaetia bacterium]